MSGLIDKETALRSISWDTEAYNAINMIPAVEVVRCKDCVFSQGFAWYACPMAGKVNPKNNDFCSRGERRTDE